MRRSETAVLGGGCFWCTEAVFSRLKGVMTVTPGYAGETTRRKPSYEDVCSGTTGFAEVIRMDFDPDIISYRQLLDVFFHTHDPTTLNRQGYDTGTQYRSVIFYANPAQKKEAENVIKNLEKRKEYPGPIVTEVKPLSSYCDAEDYHKKYFEKNENAPYCAFVIAPKISHFKERYKSLCK